MTKLVTNQVSKPLEPVLEIAGRLFRERGYSATTVREIAAAANMLPGSLHYRYASKEDLLLALIDHGIERATTAVRVAITGIDDPLERLRAALRAHLSLLVHEDVSIYVLLYEGRSLSGETRAHVVRHRDRYDALWDGILHAAAGTGALRPDADLRLVRLLLLGAANWTAQWFSPKGKYSSNDVADVFIELVWNGLAKTGGPRVLSLARSGSRFRKGERS
ncbi:MAG TPA: TetR/AcrR family transcriptional regulator [Gemmatimonadaceae bacterium]|nr:TetR/AcrR family transcriptional regulator [Gemmatimonadaceae bacterium]